MSFLLINSFRFAAPVADSLSFITSATEGTASSITIPATAQSGDIGVIFSHAVDQSGVPSDDTPTNWTKVLTNPGSGGIGQKNRTSVFQKILESGDPSSSVTCLTGTNLQEHICFIFRPSNPVSSLANTVTNLDSTNQNPSAQTVGTQTEPYLVVASAGANNTGVGSSNPLSPSSPSVDGSAYVESMQAGYWIYNTGEGTSVSADMDDEGVGNHLTSASIEPTFS